MISHQAMFALDDTAFLLADLGSAARFNPPGWLDQNVPSGFPTDVDARIRRGARNLTLSDVIGQEANIDLMFDPAETMLRSVRGNSKVKGLVAEQQKRIAAMKALVKQKY